MSLRGNIETMPVGDLLDWLDRRMACGILTLTRGMVVRRFHIDAGYVTLASSTDQKALVGRMLVERGLVSDVELERAVKAGKETGARLGRVLTLVGLVPEDTMRTLIGDKIATLVADTLSWTDGRFVFDDGAVPKGRPVVPVSVNLRDALAVARSAPADLALM